MSVPQKSLMGYFVLSLLLLLLLLFSLDLTSYAQSDPPTHPDGWDLSFGGDGTVESGCGGFSVGVNAGQFVVQPDDKIVMFAGCDSISTLLRFLPDGTVDTSFGVNGRATISQTYGIAGIPSLQSDGKLVTFQEFDEYRVVRYQANGALDPSFGEAGSTAIPFRAAQILTQADNKIIALGSQNNEGVVRLTQNGALDSTFSGDGSIGINDLLPKPNPQAQHGLVEAAPQPDGKLLLVAYSAWKANEFATEYTHRIVLMRLQNNGAFDPQFATNGVYTATLTTKPSSSLELTFCRQRLLVQPDGRILLKDAERDGLIRLSTAGVLDSSFQTGYSCLNQMLIDKAGYILGAENNNTRRLLPDGALDTSWGKDGLLHFGDIEDKIGLQKDGSLIVGSTARLARNLKAREHPTITPATPTPTLEPTPTATPTPLLPNQRSLAMIYAVLDNNLGDEWTRLVNNIEAGAHAGVDVRLLIDGPSTNDVFVYDIQPDRNPYCPSLENPTCNGRYPELRFFTEDTARPHALYQFVLDSLNAFPQAPQTSLTIIGHGSGWGANALPAQPSIWRGQNDTLGGMLWDDHPGVQSGSRSLSTLALGQALHWATTETGRRINLIYLDGCSMGMAEVAYELRNRADVLLASPNTDWATFSYDHLLPAVNYQLDGAALGERWLALETATLRSQPGYPFTLALTDLRQVGMLSNTVSALGDALQAILPTQRTQISTAFANSDRFDSNYDAKLDNADTYLDLGDFAHQLQQVGITDTVVISQAQGVQTALASVVISQVYQSGAPWLAEEQQWNWQNLSGLSIYAPLHEDETKRRIYYNATNLTWAQDTGWDEFLAAYWLNAVEAATPHAEMPVCAATTQGCVGLAKPLPVQAFEYRVHLPLVTR